MKPLAYIDGWLAHMNDQPKNPYNAFTQEASYTAWDSGYCARFNLMKHEHTEKVCQLDDEYDEYLAAL